MEGERAVSHLPMKTPLALEQSYTETHTVQIMHEFLCLSAPSAAHMLTQSKPEGWCWCVVTVVMPASINMSL